MKKLSLFMFVVLMSFGLSACDTPAIEDEKNVTEEEAVVVEDVPVVEEVLEPETMTVNLYYYNLEADKEIADYISCSGDAILPVEREIQVVEDDVPTYTLNELLKGQITTEEAADGFQTEFAPGKLELKSLTIKDGVATVEFLDDKGFTSGGSCRVGILASQIQKTLLQFPEITKVEFANEEMFQP
jgi:spore germination protein GerM